MHFQEEPTGYEKMALSDLQSAWQNLQETVVERHSFPEWEWLLFHIDIDAGMSHLNRAYIRCHASQF